MRLPLLFRGLFPCSLGLWALILIVVHSWRDEFADCSLLSHLRVTARFLLLEQRHAFFHRQRPFRHRRRRPLLIPFLLLLQKCHTLFQRQHRRHGRRSCHSRRILHRRRLFFRRRRRFLLQLAYHWRRLRGNLASTSRIPAALERSHAFAYAHTGRYCCRGMLRNIRLLLPFRLLLSRGPFTRKLCICWRSGRLSAALRL